MLPRACRLFALLSVCASPAQAAGPPLPAPSLEPPRRVVLVAASTDAPVDPVQGWAVSLRTRVMTAVARQHRKMPKGALVKLAFTVTETGQLASIRGEGDPRAVEQVLAAVRGIGHVPPPPDHQAHPVAVPIRILK